MLVMSREPDDLEKIQAPSAQEIKTEFQITAKRLANKVSFRGRKMGYGPLLNAVVIHYLSLSDDEQLEIARAGTARYEQILESDDPVSDPRLVDMRPKWGEAGVDEDFAKELRRGRTLQPKASDEESVPAPGPDLSSKGVVFLGGSIRKVGSKSKRKDKPSKPE